MHLLFYFFRFQTCIYEAIKMELLIRLYLWLRIYIYSHNVSATIHYSKRR